MYNSLAAPLLRLPGVGSSGNGGCCHWELLHSGSPMRSDQGCSPRWDNPTVHSLFYFFNGGFTKRAELGPGSCRDALLQGKWVWGRINGADSFLLPVKAFTSSARLAVVSWAIAPVV